MVGKATIDVIYLSRPDIFHKIIVVVVDGANDACLKRRCPHVLVPGLLARPRLPSQSRRSEWTSDKVVVVGFATLRNTLELAHSSNENIDYNEVKRKSLCAFFARALESEKSEREREREETRTATTTTVHKVRVRES